MRPAAAFCPHAPEDLRYLGVLRHSGGPDRVHVVECRSRGAVLSLGSLVAPSRRRSPVTAMVPSSPRFS